MPRFVSNSKKPQKTPPPSPSFFYVSAKGVTAEVECPRGMERAREIAAHRYGADASVVTQRPPKDIDEHIFDMAHIVVCDDCNDDYSRSSAAGGLYFEGYSVCPICAPSWRSRAAGNRDSALVIESLPGETFFAFVVRMRGDSSYRAISSIPAQRSVMGGAS